MHSIVKVTTPATVFDLTTVEDANRFLGLTPTTDGDAILADQITSASQIIAYQCDRVFAKETVVQTFIMRWGECIEALNLDRPPIIDLASIDDCGQILTEDQYDFDPIKAIVWRRMNFLFSPWMWSSHRIAVTYTGGYDLPDEAPSDLELACLALIKEQRFAQKRGDPTIRSLQHADSAVFFQQGSTAYTTGQGALPPSVQQLIAPYKLPPYA